MNTQKDSRIVANRSKRVIGQSDLRRSAPSVRKTNAASRTAERHALFLYARISMAVVPAQTGTTEPLEYVISLLHACCAGDEIHSPKTFNITHISR